MPVIFQDFFNDNGFTTLSAHTPDVGTGWTEDFTSPNQSTPNAMNITFEEDAATPSREDDNSRMATVTTETMSSANYQITVNLKTTPSDPDAPFFLAGRYDDDFGFYGAGGYRPNGGADQSRGLVMFSIRGGTVFYLDANPNIGITAGDELRFIVTDERKALYLNGNLVLQSNDNAITDAGRAGMVFGNWLSTLDDVDNDMEISDFTVDTTIAPEPAKTEIPLIRVPSGPNSQVQLYKWEGLNETNRGEPFVEPRLTRKSIQVVGTFAGGLVRMEGALIPPGSPDAFPGMFVHMEDSLGIPVSFLANGVIDRINHAFAYRPVVVSGSGADVTLFLLSVEGG